LRRAFPLRPAGDKASDEAKEAIAARNVVDGVRLIAEYREDGIGAHRCGRSCTAGRCTAARELDRARIIDDLVDQMDSVCRPAAGREASFTDRRRQHGQTPGAAMLSLDKASSGPRNTRESTRHTARAATHSACVVAMQKHRRSVRGPALPTRTLAALVEPRLKPGLRRCSANPANRLRREFFTARSWTQNDATKIVSWNDLGWRSNARWVKWGWPRSR
jgi:hypothetical protein